MNLSETMQDQNIHCPCGSGQPYSQCCALYHQGQPAPTAQKLMQSRFSAYALKQIDYLIDTTWPRQQPALKKQEIHQRADNTHWIRLDIIDTEAGLTTDVTGIVEFKATFTTPEDLKEQVYHERSDFIKEEGRWYFIYPNLRQSSEAKKRPNRNDPCICGSGRKFKKCCMS